MSKLDDFEELLRTSTMVSEVLRRFPNYYGEIFDNLILRLGQSRFYLYVLIKSVHIFEADHQDVINFEDHTEDGIIDLVPVDWFLEEEGERLPLEIRKFIYFHLDLFL